MELQEFARDMVKQAGMASTAYRGAKALYSGAGMLGRKAISKPGRELMYSSAKTTAGQLKGQAAKGAKSIAKEYTKPVKSLGQLRALAKEKGWKLKDILSIAGGEKLIGKGTRSDLARKAVRRNVKSLKRGAKVYGGTAAGAGLLGVGGAYESYKDRNRGK